ncbi:hypothetical protein P8T11_24955 [Achromobacter spanius]|uniref:Type I-E CRISPR-associated protein Cse1/CasA n=1 Tax=Achromobacter spanius TaxID=217203 RepID=A0ABY8GS35_9BURK|nr:MULTISPECIES: hypothetical protein [Achromobacter]WAI83234.1 hypothetical protein N8Z00_27695 [Achromobacter spanius]WEX93320.1 hypothetical protein N3Z32_22295 [Achromobacter sp. SS2-2022]WFP07522.1 hypothetical protein P8T11_24955 [Achromobacter spanius]
MSWLFSQALVEEFSAATCSDGEPSAPSNTTPTPVAFYWPDKTTEHFRLSQFGMTSEPLTADLGAALLTWCLAVSPARMSALPEKVTGSTENAPAFGQKWLGSLARYDHDSRSWKTAQYSLLGGSAEFLATWPAWGSMRNGECWERIMPELRTCGTDYGLWPTPCATDSSDRKVSARMHETKNGTFKHIGENGTLSQVRLSQVVKHRTPDGVGRMNPDWVEWLMGWPIGHTGLKPLETARFREWQQQHSIFSAAESKEAA